MDSCDPIRSVAIACPGITARRLFTLPVDRLRFAGLSKARRGAPASLDDLAGHDHVGFRNPATGQVLSWRFANPRGKSLARFTPKPTHVFDDAHAALDLVREGFGVSWSPAWIIADDLRSGRLVEAMRDWRIPEEPLWLVRTSSRQAPKRTLRTMEFLDSLAPTWRP